MDNLTSDIGGNHALHLAHAAQFDEFYTQYDDIERELNAYLEYDNNVFRDKTILLPCDDPEWSNFTKYFAQNFNRLGVKKLISTSYAQDCKPTREPIQRSLFEIDNPPYDKSHGKIFTLTRSTKSVNIHNLKWKYLDGDGDYQSNEVKMLRDEADIIVTNPPFSKFRDFVNWVMMANKKMLIVGNVNAITYREIFPLIKDNKLWLGAHSGDMAFRVPNDSEPKPTRFWIDKAGNKWRSLGNIYWFTNLEHGRRHTPLQLMTMEDNLRFSSHKNHNKFPLLYKKYDNYDAIEVSWVDAIPSNYNGVMGVPVTFLDKYCPEQFSIMGCSYSYGDPGCHLDNETWNTLISKQNIYKRLFIKRK